MGKQLVQLAISLSVNRVLALYNVWIVWRITRANTSSLNTTIKRLRMRENTEMAGKMSAKIMGVNAGKASTL